MTLTPAFLDAVKVEVAILQAKHPVLADVLSRAQALLVDGHVWVEEDGQTATVRSSDGERFYHVNGHCACPASQYRDEPCKHRLALRLYQKVSAAMVETPGVEAPADIPAQHIVMIQGKPFIKFAGLLQMAHARGLMSLTTTWTFNDAELSLAQAVAVFPFGTYTECGDATSANVNKKVAVHFRRCALTRASSRCLRNALGIDLVAVEELADN